MRTLARKLVLYYNKKKISLTQHANSYNKYFFHFLVAQAQQKNEMFVQSASHQVIWDHQQKVMETLPPKTISKNQLHYVSVVDSLFLFIANSTHIFNANETTTHNLSAYIYYMKVIWFMQAILFLILLIYEKSIPKRFRYKYAVCTKMKSTQSFACVTLIYQCFIFEIFCSRKKDLSLSRSRERDRAPTHNTQLLHYTPRPVTTSCIL